MIKNLKIGPVPAVAFSILAIIVWVAAYFNLVPNTMLGGFAIILTVGWLLGTIGGSIPGIKSFGGPALLSLMIPAFLVLYKVITPETIEITSDFMKKTDFLGFYITVLVCGSMLGMHKKLLLDGIIRLILPMILSIIVGISVGALSGMLLGFDIKTAIFIITIPVLAGGIGEGLLPLSIGYAAVTGLPYEDLVGTLVPAVVLGNLFSIFYAGLINYLGNNGMKKHSGHGQLVKSGDGSTTYIDDISGETDFGLMAGAILTGASLFIMGIITENVLAQLTGIKIPGLVLMIVIALIIKLLGLFPFEMERGAKQLYTFISKNFTFPLMAGLGIVYIDLAKVQDVLSVKYFLVIFCVVTSMVLVGFLSAKLLKMYPIESALITVCRSGMGGTGDVAILSAADRMELMPFAQVITRIGGALTVLSAISLLKIVFGGSLPL